MSFSDNSAKATGISLRLALSRVADVQAELAASAARIEHVVSTLVATLDPNHKTVSDLQELDLTRQSMENLGRLLVTLSEHAPEHVQVSAEQVKASINLSALAGTILNGAVAEEDKQAAGEVHLFDFG